MILNSIRTIIKTFLLETQFWVSLMILFLSLFFSKVHHICDVNRQIVVFFATLGGYNFIHYHKFWRKKRYLFNAVLFLISLIAMVNLFFKINESRLFLMVAFLSLFVLVYNSAFLKFQLRNIALLKIFVISCVWSCIVLFVGNIFKLSLSEFLSVFLFILGITIPFDISDLATDSVYTIPGFLGIVWSKILSVISLFISAVLFLLHNKDILLILCWVIGCAYGVFITIFIRKKSYFLTRFWLEGTSGIPLLAYFIYKLVN